MFYTDWIPVDNVKVSQAEIWRETYHMRVREVALMKSEESLLICKHLFYSVAFGSRGPSGVNKTLETERSTRAKG